MNFIIDGIILWLAARIFPNVVQIADFKTLVIAVILLSILTLLISLICAITVLQDLLIGDLGAAVFAGIASLFASVIAMSILSSHLPGFYIAGFWPKVLLAFCFSSLQANTTISGRRNR